jgi:hypothetical protein
MIYEYSAHHLSGDPEEMRATLPVHFILIDEPEIGFVDQCCRLKCVICALAAKIMGCQAAEFAIDYWHKLIERRRIAVAPIIEQLSYLSR